MIQSLLRLRDSQQYSQQCPHRSETRFNIPYLLDQRFDSSAKKSHLNICSTERKNTLAFYTAAIQLRYLWSLDMTFTAAPSGGRFITRS